MSEFPRPVPVPRRPFEAEDRLESWKEIAAYLGREVRTAQGWEKNEGLPIHRHQHARQGSVYAFRSELDVWRNARRSVAEATAVVPGEEAAAPAHKSKWFALGGAAAIAVLGVGGFFVWKQRSAPESETLSSIVVLPFLDLSPQKDQEYFSDGLTEEIIDALSRVPNLRVVARTTAFAFKGKATDIRQIGRQLNVSVVLEGSVRKAGDQLRITAQLNRVSDGYHLWSRTYDRQLRDVFSVQRQISQSIAEQLRAGQVPQRGATTDVAAYDLYQEGRYFFNKHEPPDSYWKAIDRYQKAIQRDPKFALAYSGMADAYAYLAENFAVWPKEIMPKAKAAAEQAVRLDDNLAEAHTSVGIVKLDFEWDREGARRELERAMQLNPGSGWVHHWVAHSLEAQGRLEDAMKEMRAALELDPLSLPIHWDVANELLMAKKFDEALQFLDKADELFPNQPITTWERATAYHYKGDAARADRTLVAFLAANTGLVEDPSILAMKGAVAGWAGRHAEARQILGQIEQVHKTRYVEPFMVMALCSASGDHKGLLLWLERAYQEHSTFFLYGPLAWFFYDDDPEVKKFLTQHR
jgi:TolB-like protein/Tfp pilus assembly protein PilF